VCFSEFQNRDKRPVDILMERAILSYIKEKIETAIENGSIKPCDPELTAFVMLKHGYCTNLGVLLKNFNSQLVCFSEFQNRDKRPVDIKEKIETAIENGSIKPCDPELTAFVMLKLYIALIPKK
jgi:hypothetical protein